MYSEKEFTELEQDERQLTDEMIAVMLLILANTKTSLEKEIRSFYSKYGKDGVVTYQEARKWVSTIDHRRRLTVLNLFLSNEFAKTHDSLKIEFEKMLKSVVSKETDFFGVDIDTQSVLTTKWGEDNNTWQQRLEYYINLWSIRIAFDWKRSLTKDATLNVVLELLDNRFMSIEKVLKRFGLDESTAIGSLSRYKIFRELGITKYQFYTVPDERRCEICGSMHGTIFPISAYEVGVTASPIHNRCRCWEIPILE